MRLRILHVDHATVDAEDLQNLLIMAIANRASKRSSSLCEQTLTFSPRTACDSCASVDVDVEADAAIRRTGALAPTISGVTCPGTNLVTGYGP